jgi:hypothetical protein
MTAKLPDHFYREPSHPTALIGLPHLMEMAFRGADLQPLARGLIERAAHGPGDANALMDLSCIMRLTGQGELGQRIQDDALSLSRHYTLPATGTESLRVLTIMTPGTLMDNAPIEFLLQGSQLTLEMVYVDPAQGTLPEKLPDHDVAYIGVSESEQTRTLLACLAQQAGLLPRPTLNDPHRILAVAREHAWRALQGIPGCVAPPASSVTRQMLERLSRGELSVAELLPAASFPIICRPHGSHAGHGLVKLADAHALAHHLAQDPSEHFYISPFVDYVSADGQYRKYRIAFVGGQAYPVHLAVSKRWMVHYLNGDMLDRPDNRAHEQSFMDAFAQDFGARHAQALAAIDERIGLDYFSIDCAELPDGRLLIFEVDSGAVVHAMDPLADFGYKRPHMLRVFHAFQALLARAALEPSCLKPWQAVPQARRA